MSMNVNEAHSRRERMVSEHEDAKADGMLRRHSSRRPTGGERYNLKEGLESCKTAAGSEP